MAKNHQNIIVKPLPSFSAGSIKRAQNAINMMLDSKGFDIRQFESQFEMYDGEFVSLLIMHTFRSYKISFENLPEKTKIYMGISFWNTLEEKYDFFVEMQQKLPL